MYKKQRIGVAPICCGLAFLCILLVWALPVGASSRENIFNLDQFIDPETCGACHDEIMAQWQGSMHNLSHKDPVYIRVAKFFRQGLTDAGQIEEAESCVKCHTPVGVVTGFPEKLSV